MLNLTHLRTLIEVVRLGSLTGAGNRLGYTASAVSQQMASLERETGLHLFVRSARSIQPTAAGRAMAQEAAALLRGAEDLVRAGAAAAATMPTLRLGAFPSATTLLLPRVLVDPAWVEAGVRTTVTVAEPSELVPALRSGGDLDAAVLYQVGSAGLELPQGVRRRWLRDDVFRVVVPQALADELGRAAGAPAAGSGDGLVVEASALARVPWILHRRGSSDAVVLDAILGNAGIHPEVSAWSDDFNATLGLVAGGQGVALVPDAVLVRRPAGTCVVDVPEISLARTLMLVCADGVDEHLEDLLADALLGALQHQG